MDFPPGIQAPELRNPNQRSWLSGYDSRKLIVELPTFLNMVLHVHPNFVNNDVMEAHFCD